MHVELIEIRTMEATVEDYIFRKKGIRVKIDIQATVVGNHRIMAEMILQDQLNKLNHAYGIALNNQ